MKKLLTAIITLAMVVTGAACAVPEAAAPATAGPATSTLVPETSVATASLPETTIPPASTLPPAYETYSKQGWLLISWNISHLWTEPESPASGRPVNVWASIYIADIPMTFIQAELSVNGKVVDSRQLSLWFDDPLPFSLVFTPDKPGVYDLVVRANMIENEQHSRETGEDLSLYSTMTLTVTA